MAETAASFSADAVVSTPPFYFVMDQTELAEYYESLVPQLNLPLYLYNMPVNTKISFDPKTIKRIAENPRVVGFKDSSGNAPYLQRVIHEMRNCENFSIFVGPEEMTAEMVLLALLKEQEMYGYQLSQTLKEKSNGKYVLQEGSMYPILYRMLDKGLIGERREIVGKRRTRVYYAITELGLTRLDEIVHEYLDVTAGIKGVMKL